MKTQKIILLSLAISCFSCGNLDQVLKEITELPTGLPNPDPSQLEMGMGLKEALEKGTLQGVASLHEKGGFWKDSLLRIAFPPEVAKVESRLRSMGFNSQVDRLNQSLNEAAEDAVIEAKPIFINAIKELTFNDVKTILLSDGHPATNYLSKTTSEALGHSFQPKIKASLDKVNATKYWNEVMTLYNQIPFVEKVNADLPAYVTERAISGLFLQIQEEEEAIRKNPLERSSDLLKKVFSYADRN